MDFAQALPLLVSSYRRGELVPFIGSGMSYEACVLWSPFVDQLEQEVTGVSPALQQANKDDPSKLIRRADLAVKQLLTFGANRFQAACRKAVKNPDPKLASRAPDKTVELTRTSWSLVVSTNYDDWYSALVRRRRRNTVRVLSRSPADCQEVLESLTRSTGPILWAVQGFLGAQADEPDLIPHDKLYELASQVVVGHHHYQRVINSEQLRTALPQGVRRCVQASVVPLPRLRAEGGLPRKLVQRDPSNLRGRLAAPLRHVHEERSRRTCRLSPDPPQRHAYHLRRLSGPPEAPCRPRGGVLP